MKKDWVLTIGIDKYYLTSEQKEFYLKSIADGNKYVVIDNKYLGVSFQSLVHKDVIEETKMINDGKYRCVYNKWHPNGVSCSCRYSYKIEDGKAIRIIEDNY